MFTVPQDSVGQMDPFQSFLFLDLKLKPDKHFLTFFSRVWEGAKGQRYSLSPKGPISIANDRICDCEVGQEGIQSYARRLSKPGQRPSPGSPGSEPETRQGFHS